MLSIPYLFLFAEMLPGRNILKKKKPDEKSSGKCRSKYPAVPLGFDYNLHKKAGGSPKLCFSASNVRPEPGGLQSADSNRHPLLKMWV